MKPREYVLPPLVVVAILAASYLATRNQPWTATRVLGLLVMLPALALWCLARVQLGKSFSVTPQARELVTQGLYSRIRNPIYVFGGLAILGLFLFLGKLYLLWAFVFLVPLQIFRAKREREILEGKFGQAYLEYKRKTWF